MSRKYSGTHIHSNGLIGPIRAAAPESLRWAVRRLRTVPTVQWFRQLQLPLERDLSEGWKPHPIFHGRTPRIADLSCHVSVLEPGHSPHPPHAHAHEEVLIVLSGEASLVVVDEGTGEQDVHVVTRGDIIYYPAHLLHTIRNDGSEPATYLMFKWRGIRRSMRHALGLQFSSARERSSVSREAGTNRGGGLETHPVFQGTTGYLRTLHCHQSILQPESGYAPHADPYDVAIVVLSGTVETLGETVGPNGVVFYGAGLQHGMMNPAQEPAEYLVFQFQSRSVARTADALTGRAGRVAARWVPRATGRPGTPGAISGRTPRRAVRPTTIHLEASSVCQLKCPSCPTANGQARPALGWGFLTLDNFRRIIDENPKLAHIELSNYGEILLNPQLLEMLRYAYRRGVTLSAQNGVNLNNVRVAVLEGLARYRLRSMTCSIDGASQETYSQYRVGGQFDRVVENIRILNTYKEHYRTSFPRLAWQFVVFGHNEHEIPRAREMAQDLGMEFKLKLNWDPSFSPVRDPEAVRRQLGAASRAEFRQIHGRDYAAAGCQKLWTAPQINWNGDVLGCARNFWGVFGGNVFADGLIEAANSEGIRYAREMLQGRSPAREGIPCSTCEIYLDMRESGRWLRPPAPRSPRGWARKVVRMSRAPRLLRLIANNIRERTRPLVARAPRTDGSDRAARGVRGPDAVTS